MLKTNKFFILVFLFLITYVDSKAQMTIDLSLRFGGNLSPFTLKNDIPGAKVTLPLAYTNFEGGVGAKLNFGKAFSVEPAINYSRKSYLIKNNGETYTFLSYLEIPVLARIQTSGRTKLYLNAGPYMSFLISAKARQTDNFTGTTKVDVKDGFKSTDFGFIAGFGVVFGRFGLDFRYNYGLANISKVDLVKLNASSLGFSFLYWLPIKK